MLAGRSRIEAVYAVTPTTATTPRLAPVAVRQPFPCLRNSTTRLPSMLDKGLDSAFETLVHTDSFAVPLKS